MPRYRLRIEDCRRGGLARAAQSSFREAQAKGTQATFDRHGRKALVDICKRTARRRGKA